MCRCVSGKNQHLNIEQTSGRNNTLDTQGRTASHSPFCRFNISMTRKSFLGIIIESANKCKSGHSKIDSTRVNVSLSRGSLNYVRSLNCTPLTEALWHNTRASDLNARERRETPAEGLNPAVVPRIVVIYDDACNKTIIGEGAFCATRYEY